jgi:hypothetical protein
MSHPGFEDWVQCRPGELSRLATELRARRRRRGAARAGVALFLGLALAAVLLWGWHAGTSPQPPRGLSCEEVAALSDAYAAGTLSPEMHDRVRQHVERCPRCRPLFRERGLISMAPVVGAGLGPPARGPSLAAPGR